MFCKMIGSNRRKAEISRTERRLKEAEFGVALEHLKLGEALLAARASKTDLASAIAASSAGTDWSPAWRQPDLSST
jgi:hypothetical protein